MFRLFLFSLLGLFLCGPLGAQESSKGADLDDLVIGSKLPDGGVYWDLPDGQGQLNLRFVGTRLRLYFADPEGKVMESPVSNALVRYRNTVPTKRSGRINVTKLTSGPGGVYLASPRVLPQPLRYFVWVVLRPEGDDAGESQVYSQKTLNGLGK